MRQSGYAAEGLAGAFRTHQQELIRLAAFILGDRAAAEDAVQDVFATLHERQHLLADPEDPLPYLRRSVINGCRTVVRRRRLMLRHDHKNQPAPALTTEESALLSEARREVLAALATLPRRRREVLVLRFYLDLTEAQIAETLGISQGTVKSTAARGLAALARVLKETR
jgi:RNA polymerase sigma-70 factor (sigma-E family)